MPYKSILIPQEFIIAWGRPCIFLIGLDQLSAILFCFKDVQFIAKEVGFGMRIETIEFNFATGVKTIDISGKGANKFFAQLKITVVQQIKLITWKLGQSSCYLITWSHKITWQKPTSASVEFVID